MAMTWFDRTLHRRSLNRQLSGSCKGLESKGFGPSSTQTHQSKRKHATFLYMLEMAESLIEHVRLTLPYELCLVSYTFMFHVDFKIIERAQAFRKCFQERGLPPQSACLEEEAYRTYRQIHVNYWSDDVEEAFFIDNVTPSGT